MGFPNSLKGNRWTEITARYALPILVWCAKKGKTITYGQVDQEIMRRGLGSHVLAVKYGWPVGAIGDALIEIEKYWDEKIPPLNAIVVNAKDGVPGKGVNEYLERYFGLNRSITSMTKKEKLAVLEEVHADVFAYDYWDDVLDECGLPSLKGKVELDKKVSVISFPKRGGWSGEGESEEHLKLKEYVSKNPHKIGLPRSNVDGIVEYLFASSDKADVVFETKNGFVGVEVKSHISNQADLNRGIFQAVKYQALLRAEQKAQSQAPNSVAVLVTEKKLSSELQSLANKLGIETYIVPVNI